MNKPSFDWIKDFPFPVTVCDSKGIIIAMNRHSVENFHKYGGESLIGTSLFDCHPQSANDIIRKQLTDHKLNTYIVEKKGLRKLVHQAPWYQDDIFAGLVETILPLPAELPVKKK